MEAAKTDVTPSFETVWAILQEVGKKHEEHAKALEEQRKRAEAEMQEIRENQKKAERQFNKRFGKYDNRFGKVVEHMIMPNLCKKFREFGFEFTKANNTKLNDYVNNIHLEIDVMLENGGDNVMLVEIKTQLTAEHVKDQINRLEKMRIYADLHGDKRKFLGAIAAVIAPSNEKKYALDQGLFVIEPSGKTFHITAPPYKPKEW